MASILKNLSEYNAELVPSAAKMTFGIVVADYNSEITFALLEGCVATLLKHGAVEKNISVHHVPGSFELPMGAQFLNEFIQPDALICLGCVITGETKHDEYISNAVANALMQLGLEYNTPFIFGVLTPRTLEQAKARAGGAHGNKGVEAAISAIKMVHLSQECGIDNR